MGPDWYIRAWEICEEFHDPDNWEGREWDELSAEEQDGCITNYILSRAD